MTIQDFVEISPKQVENAVEKREIAQYEQYLLLPQSLSKRLVLHTCKNMGFLWERDENFTEISLGPNFQYFVSN